jgi:hypothetical protein
MSRVRLVRWGSALVLVGGLLAQIGSGTAAVAQGFDVTKMAAPLRAHISGPADLALNNGQIQTPRPANYFPGPDECQTDIDNN